MVREQQEFILELLLNKMLTIAQESTKMSFDKSKTFYTRDGSYSWEHFATLDEAKAQAAIYSSKEMTDVVVYQAVTIAKTPVPTNVQFESVAS